MKHVQLPFLPEWLWWPEPWIWALGLLLLVPLYWWLWLRPQRRAVVRFSSLSLVGQAAGPNSGRMRLIVPVLRTIALAALIVAVASPQTRDASSRKFAEGIAIELAIDVSPSMVDIDLARPGTRETRLDVVKQVVMRFINGDQNLAGRTNDLVGLVRFARYADSICPLTLDHHALDSAVKPLQPVQNREEDGTAIGDGLALAVERLKDLKRTMGSGQQIKIDSRIVILLTDGENNSGLVEPQQAGEIAANLGIKVYTIMAGTGRNVGWARVPEDDKDLRHIAEVTGGKFYKARDAAALERIYQEIDQLERTKVEERSYVRWDEFRLAVPWLAVAFGALGLQTLLEATWLRKAP